MRNAIVIIAAVAAFAVAGQAAAHARLLSGTPKNGAPTRRLTLIAEKLVEKAMAGDIHAI